MLFPNAVDAHPAHASVAGDRARSGADANRLPRSDRSRLSQARLRRAALSALGALLVLVAAAPTATATTTTTTITFDAVAATSDWHGGQALGTFTMTGPVADAGTVRIAYHAFDRRIRATSTLSGAAGILTVGLRGASAPSVDGRQAAVGVWRTCGGTGRYRRVVGRGSWQAVVDVLAARGSVPVALHGAYYGRVRRCSTPRCRGDSSSGQSWC
jgi:hypothetical protein